MLHLLATATEVVLQTKPDDHPQVIVGLIFLRRFSCESNPLRVVCVLVEAEYDRFWKDNPSHEV